MIPMQAQLIAAVVIAAAAFGAGWKVQGWRWDAADKSRIEAEHKAYTDASNRINEAAQTFETAAADLAKRRTIVEREIRHEIEKPVYRDCLVPDSGLRIYHSAGETAAATGKPDAILPAASIAAGTIEHGRPSGRGSIK